MSETTLLRLKNMVFYGHHGVYPVEQELGQRIEIDLEIAANFAVAGRMDQLDHTINYVEIYGIVKEIVEKERFHLIEGIGLAIRDRIMAKYHLGNVLVRVRKPQPPVGGIMDTVEFEVRSNESLTKNS